MKIHIIDLGKTLTYIACIFSYINTCISSYVHIVIHKYTYALSHIFTHIQIPLHMLDRMSRDTRNEREGREDGRAE